MTKMLPKALSLPAHVQDALRVTAAREGRSENAVVVEAIERYTSERIRVHLAGI